MSTIHFDLCAQCANLCLDQRELDAIQLDYEIVSDNMARSKKLPAEAPAQRRTAAATGKLRKPTGPDFRKLETGFAGFTAARPDVTIQRVHFPDSGITFAATGSTQQEVDRQAREFQSLMSSFQICGTPHVEIYGPEQQVIARDVCGDKSGTLHLRKWIAAETRTSTTALLTDTGTAGVTPLPVSR
ncbi:MAG: hypothetical protein A3H91_16855 [Gammaproteobacteria bacterium RIFCSPLOWO2_02_FULL_61_13]|nr:MAG: hypothetical protein A3H91_16855 [Gammaproteobacteria bacterium RIFCSPLOWO2_02_FULL_61_13]